MQLQLESAVLGTVSRTEPLIPHVFPHGSTVLYTVHKHAAVLNTAPRVERTQARRARKHGHAGEAPAGGPGNSTASPKLLGRQQPTANKPHHFCTVMDPTGTSSTAYAGARNAQCRTVVVPEPGPSQQRRHVVYPD